MYGIKELTGNYSESELADGGILALSESVPIVKNACGTKEDPMLELIVEFQPETGRRNGAIHTRVCLDEEHGELVSARCSCMHFADDGYACAHVVALQTAWLLKKEGADAFRNSSLKEILAKKAGVPDPFIPGILRRTSGGLQKMLGSGQKMLPVGKEGSNVAPGSLHLEIYMTRIGNQFFELKVGTKRTYVVKNCYDFLRTFETHGELSFGKSLSFPAYEELFEADSRKLLQFLRGIFRLNQEERSVGYFYSAGGQNGRYVKLAGKYYDALMEMMEGKKIFGSDGSALTFSSEPYKPQITLDKLDYGASVRMESIQKLAQTMDWIYLRKGSNIFRVSYEEGRKLEEFRTLFVQQDELYVSEKDLPVLCRDVLTDIGKMAELSCIGMVLENYLPEKPKIRFYLDCPQEDMISCRPVACYQEKEFPLGKKLTGKSNRDGRFEQETLSKILPFFNAYDEKTESYVFQGQEPQLYYFLTEAIPRLAELAELFISDQLKKLKIRPLSTLSVGVAINGGLLELSMLSEEFSNDELMEILSAYNRKRKYYRLKNGAFIRVDEEQEEVLGALAECIRGLRKPTDGEWKIPLFRAVYLDEMLKDRDSVSIERSREYKRLLSRMREAQNNTYEPPESIRDTLRGYQGDGFRWIKTLKENGFGGILADDMGLGKTLQVLAFLLSEKESGKTGDEMRTLIITPASLVYNWKKEIQKYVPALSVKMVTGTAQERQQMIQDSTEDAEVWITSYDLLKRDIQWYKDVVFANEILDEAQFVKNQTTYAAKSVRLIQSSFRMALTGTPIENRISELWSIFDYLMPGFLYTYGRFREEIELPVVSDRDQDAMERLRCMVHPFILRRLKKEVLKELPDKLEEEVLVSLDGEQKKLYNAHVQRLRMYLEKQSKEEFAHGKLEILAELTKLRQLCCNPGMILENYHGSNVKLDACLELLHQAIEGGHKILLFSQFTTMLDAIGERLEKEEIAYHRIDGSVRKEERIRLVEEFDKDDVPVFCISLKAGGTGLNLTAADIVIHFDPWWNIAAQNQATDRTHRIGQTHVVTVYQLIAEGTIEEKILNLQKSKYQLAEDVLSGEGISSIMIDQEQVLSLLDGGE